MAAAAELMMTMLLLARGGNARQGKASPLSITGGGGVPSSRLERKRERRSESRRGEGDPDTGRLSVSMKGGAPMRRSFIRRPKPAVACIRRCSLPRIVQFR